MGAPKSSEVDPEGNRQESGTLDNLTVPMETWGGGGGRNPVAEEGRRGSNSMSQRAAKQKWRLQSRGHPCPEGAHRMEHHRLGRGQ